MSENMGPTGENVLKYGDQLVRMSENMRPTGENVSNMAPTGFML
jgi:hypothetical protein